MKVWKLIIWSSDHKSTTLWSHKVVRVKGPRGCFGPQGPIIYMGLSLLPNILSYDCQKQPCPKLSYLITCIISLRGTYIPIN